MERVCITGSNKYENRVKIKNIIYKLYNKFGDKLELVTCGDKYGVDRFVKEISAEFLISYSEFPAFHQEWTINTVLPKYLYNKSYSVKNYFSRNSKLIEYCDVFLIFMNENEQSPVINHILETSEKKNKKNKLFN